MRVCRSPIASPWMKGRKNERHCSLPGPRPPPATPHRRPSDPRGPPDDFDDRRGNSVLDGVVRHAFSRDRHPGPPGRRDARPPGSDGGARAGRRRDLPGGRPGRGRRLARRSPALRAGPRQPAPRPGAGIGASSPRARSGRVDDRDESRYGGWWDPAGGRPGRGAPDDE